MVITTASHSALSSARLVLALAALASCKGPGTEDVDTSDTIDVPDTTDTTDTTDTVYDTGIVEQEVPDVVPDVIVDCNGGADFTTIRAAIEASPSGTHIGLRPCTYVGDIDFIGKSLDIFGIEGSSQTTIQGSGHGSVIRVEHGESVGTRLAGVTVTGGNTEGYHGSGLAIDHALLQLEDVVFTQNDAGLAVMYANGASLELLDVEFVDNEVGSDGMIFVATNGSLLAQRMTLVCTRALYGMFTHNASLLLDSHIACGDVYGIFNQGNSVHLRRSRVESEGVALYARDQDDTRNERLFLYNSAFVGGEKAVYAEFMNVRAENNVFWGGRLGFDLRSVHEDSFITNSYARGSECGLIALGGPYELAYNAVADGPACTPGQDTVVTTAPGFVNAPHDFTLQSTSPLIDAGDPDDDLTDPDGSRNDIGMFGGREGGGQP